MSMYVEGIYGQNLTETGSKDDCDTGTKLHTETSRRRVKGQAVTKVAHDVVSISPDTKSNSSTTKATTKCQ